MSYYARLVYGIRLTKPLTVEEDIAADELAIELRLPEGLCVQSPDSEQGWEWENMCPVVYVEASCCSPYTVERYIGSVASIDTDPAWDALLASAANTLQVEIESKPRWYAFVSQ